MRMYSGMLVPAAVALLALCSGCEQLAKQVLEAGKPKTIRSKDGAFELTVPAGWREDLSLHEKSDLGASDPADELYVTILSESADDFVEMNLERHSQTTRSILLSGLKSPAASGPRKLVIDGQPALEYEIRGASENTRICYLHTTVELGQQYHQILAWTLLSRCERNKPLLRQVTASFRQVRPAAPTGR